MENVKISIPNEAGALRAASKMLAEMAGAHAETLMGAAEQSAERARNHALDATSYATGYGDGASVSMAEREQWAESEPDVADRSHIEAKIPASQGGHMPDAERSTEQVFGTPTEQPTPAPAATGVELDSSGLPWDSRINPESRGTLKKTGEWKLKRGIDKEYVDEVKAELRAAMSAGGTQPTPTAQSIPQDFQSLLLRITTDGVPKATVDEAAREFGFADFGTVATRPDLVPQIAARIFGG